MPLGPDLRLRGILFPAAAETCPSAFVNLADNMAECGLISGSSSKHFDRFRYLRRKMDTELNFIVTQCDEVVAKYSLLGHSFYQRWSAGTLPVAALSKYAGEYGTFIRTFGRNWEAVGKPELARREDGHSKVWDDTFAKALGATVDVPQVREVAELIATSQNMSNERASALGALYAIESQQAIVAKAKLKGLREHYAELPEQCGEYFRLHSDDYDEVSILVDEINKLGVEDKEKALSACETMCKALYNSLSGIEAPYLEP